MHIHGIFLIDMKQDIFATYVSSMKSSPSHPFVIKKVGKGRENKIRPLACTVIRYNAGLIPFNECLCGSFPEEIVII